MKTWTATIAALLIVAVAITLWRARLRSVRQPAIKAVFARPGLLEISSAQRLADVRVLDRHGNQVAMGAGHGQPVLQVRFAWQPGATYAIVFGDGPPLKVTAPDQVSIFTIRLHAPLGQIEHCWSSHELTGTDADQTIDVPVAPGEAVDIMLDVEKMLEQETYTCRVQCEDPQCEVRSGTEPVTLDLEFDKMVWMAQLKPGDPIPLQPVTVRVAMGREQGAAWNWTFRLRCVQRRIDTNSIAVVHWHLPTDELGLVSRRAASEQINLPNPCWRRVALWFNIHTDEPDYYEPYTYQCAVLENKTRHPLSLLLTAEVLENASDQVSPWFLAPNYRDTGGLRKIMAFARLEPGESTRCVQPVFVRPDTPPGMYRRKLTIQPTGSDQVVKTVTAPLGVVRDNALFSGWLLAIGGISLVWLSLVCWFYRAMVRLLGLRVLVLLSLLGSLQFCLHFAGGLISNVFYAVLGPFNCLVGGLLTEVMTYLLVTSILYLCPRVGAMTLAGLVSYIMGGVMFGSFGLTDILFIGSSIAFRELFLFCCGVTRLGEPGHNPPSLLALILALGLADAASTFTSLTLHSVFYRLFFADWYIFLQVVVTGFGYTALGVYLGKPLGLSLRKIHL